MFVMNLQCLQRRCCCCDSFRHLTVLVTGSALKKEFLFYSTVIVYLTNNDKGNTFYNIIIKVCLKEIIKNHDFPKTWI